MITRAGLVVAALVALGTTACGGAGEGAHTRAPAKDASTKNEPARAQDPVLVCADTRESVPADQIARIEIQGARVPQELCTRVKHGIGRPLDDQRVDDDVRALYADGRVEDIIVLREEGARTVLVYSVRMRPPIVTFEIQGADPSGALPAGVVLERPEVADPGIVRAMTSDATREMRGAGYLHATVDFEMTPREGGVALVLRVAPGPRAIVRAVRFEGPSSDRARELSASMRTTAGKPLERQALERDVLVIQADGYDKGRLTTTVAEPELVESDGGAAVEIVLRVNEGPVFRLGKVSFEGDLIGPVKTYERDFWTSKPGAIFSRTVVATDIERIRAFHESRGSIVDVNPSVELDAAHEKVDVKVRIEQRR
ncbi:POTRA domain-containing protein [Polyangium sp. y55x31]|uniref:POTRA domain-containing protein n=1 Tax=Polyangium sp. y55x31 TaxID=3042688 RepID=UPI002482E886|nr:POTRA domain-containing protein [Polyangium sp. y55x31]MDI1484195.1 POTRA domain-containing protein [Polyangium sp. y55x31]